MAEEVRYHMLRPDQIVARRKARPVVYIPVGTIEWHGVHNAVGADTLQAEGLAIRCAEKGGGLVFPSLYYGESRLEGLMEANASDRDLIAQRMELSPDNFTQALMPFSPMEQQLNHQRLLLHILSEAATLGFELGVLVPGHYPLIHACRAAMQIFNMNRRGMLAWACIDYLLVKEQYPQAGDHAGYWETSHMMHLHPQTVDLSRLGPEDSPLVGIHTRQPVRQSNAQFGRETLEAAADVVLHEVEDRLRDKAFYRSWGCDLVEGRWKKPAK